MYGACAGDVLFSIKMQAWETTCESHWYTWCLICVIWLQSGHNRNVKASWYFLELLSWEQWLKPCCHARLPGWQQSLQEVTAFWWNRSDCWSCPNHVLSATCSKPPSESLERGLVIGLRYSLGDPQWFPTHSSSQPWLTICNLFSGRFCSRPVFTVTLRVSQFLLKVILPLRLFPSIRGSDWLTGFQ